MPDTSTRYFNRALEGDSILVAPETFTAIESLMSPLAAKSGTANRVVLVSSNFGLASRSRERVRMVRPPRTSRILCQHEDSWCSRQTSDVLALLRAGPLSLSPGLCAQTAQEPDWTIESFVDTMLMAQSSSIAMRRRRQESEYRTPRWDCPY